MKKKNNRELKEVKLSDTNYFDLFIGERVVKRDLVKIHGNIPLYSANVFKPVGFLDKGNITDFNNDFVLWGIDGDFEFNYIKREEKFATTDHCGAVRIKTDKIIPAYLLHQLNEVKKLYGYDRSLRASLKNMKEVAINIPIDSTGEFDVEEQQEIANNSTLIEEIKEKVNFYKEKIESTNIILNIREYNFKEVSISGIFEVLPIPQKLSKKDIQKGGSIPVYSSQSDNFGLIGNAEVMMFDANEDSPLVTFGDHTRTIYIRTNPFSVLDNVKVLKLKEAFRNTVDIKYICYKWKPLIYDLGYSRHWKEAKNTKIPIPINSKDEYDLKAQKEISQKYQVIEQVKQELEEKLNNLLKVNVTL